MHSPLPLQVLHFYFLYFDILCFLARCEVLMYSVTDKLKRLIFLQKCQLLNCIMHVTFAEV